MSLVTRMCFLLFSSFVVASAEIDAADPFLYAVAATEHTGDELTDEVLASLSMGNRNLVQKRIGSFETILHPMFVATPKNEVGRLGHAAARYTLHRFFVNRHGWFVHGLFAGQGGLGWNSTSLTTLLKTHTTAYVQNAFERQLDKDGLNLRGVALLAAVVEVSVYDAAEKDLRTCYKRHNLQLNATIDDEDLDRLLALHIASRVLEANHAKELHKFLQSRPEGQRDQYSIEDVEPLVLEIMPQWPLTTDFLKGLRMELQPGRSEFSYEMVAGLTREIEARWARWAAKQDCQAMKLELLKLEEGASGCVRLGDFYNYSFNSPSGWGFKESPLYLRQLGALDESKGEVPRVIISNYLQSQSNCIPMTNHYMACCVNDCESLQTQIEASLQMPEAKPEAILKVVNQLPSPESFSRQQVLPRSLKAHLDEIAAVHGGQVPLQSRLFSQWMHFVFPHECPFPYVAGSKRPEEPKRASHFVRDSVALKIVQQASHFERLHSNSTCKHWDQEEEIFLPTFVPSTTTLAQLEQDSSVWAAIYGVAVCSASALLVAALLKTLKQAKPTLGDFKPTFLV